MPRWAKVSLGVVAGLVVLVVAAVLILTQTDFGRERVRRIALDQLRNSAHGNVSIGRVRGNLLTGATIENLVIEDSTGAPFFRADTISVGYSLTAFLRQRIDLVGVRLVRPVVVLDRPPGLAWNFARIFPSDTTVAPSRQGFGAWISIRDLDVVDGRVTVRNEWLPADTLAGDARQLAIEEALSTESRLLVVEVPGGFQSVQDYQSMNGRFDRLRLADPDSAAIVVDVGELSLLAFPFRPPAAEIRSLSGRVVSAGDTLVAEGVQIALPGSRLALEGTYLLSGGLEAAVTARPLAFADLRWLHPPLPDGSGSVDAHVVQRGARTRVLVREVDLAMEGASLAGHLDVAFGDSLRLGPTDLRFAGVETDLIRRLAPDVEIPRDGTLAGRVALTGSPEALTVDGEASFADRRGGVSRLIADGVVGTGDRGFRAENLRLRLAPLQLTLAGAAGVDLPVGGVITGTAALTGSSGEGFDLRADLAHQSPETGRSHISANGALLRAGDTFAARGLNLRVDPVQMALVRAFAPDLPLSGIVAGTARVDGTLADLALAADLIHDSGATGRSRVTVQGGVALGDEPRARNLRLRFDPVQMALARAFSPDLPLDGTVSGTATLSGTQADLQVTADLLHASPEIGDSRVTAAGAVGLGDAFRARNLRLGFAPLQVALGRAFDPELPVDGVLSGTATVNGSTATSMAVVADLTHTGSTGRSRLVGNAALPMGGSGRVAADLRVLPLSLETVGLFAPSAGLQGSATGAVEASGTLRDLALSLGLAFQDGGTLSLAGRLDLESARQAYDLNASFAAFDASAVTTRAPSTALTGSASAVGRGTDPATMAATVTADLTGVAIDEVRVDSVQVRATLAEGLARVERGAVRLASAAADVTGSFGLAENRTGTLYYAVRVDTLSDFSALVPPDTGSVAPRPAEVARAMERARADSARIALATEVERAATGRPAAPTLPVDPFPPLPRDSLAGSLEASGTLSGSVARFDVEGRARVDDLVVLGNTVGSGDVSYRWLNAPTPASDLEVDAELGDARLAGFVLDSIGARVRYAGDGAGGAGSVDLLVVQDGERDYRAEAEFRLSPEGNEVRYSDLALRFDDVHWRSTRPGTVSWAEGGIEVEDVELLSDAGGRIFAEGTLPAEGEADFRIAVDDLQIADVLGLLQDTVPLRGLVSLAAEVRGTAADPVIDGLLEMRQILVDTVAVPDVEASFDYASRELHADARMTQAAQPLLTAEAWIPIDLALSGATEPRFAEDAPLQIDILADSLPLEALPGFTDAIEDVRGRVRGNVAVRGTAADPELSGVIDLDLGALTIVQPGLALEEIAGTVRFVGEGLVVDSITASSGGGTIRVTGGIGLPELTEPVFDLRLAARGARVLNNELGRIAADADLEMTGALDGASITGRIEVLGGVLYAPELDAPRRVEIDTPDIAALGDTAALRLVDTNPLLANLRVDVSVAIARDTWVRNSAANIEIFTPPGTDDLAVRMDGGPQTLALNGTINVDRGEYTFAGRRIRLSQGAVVFLGETPINPILQITAEQQVRLAGRPAFAIQLLVGGTLLEPRLTIESNAQPPIAESDLLSYFAFGESTSSLIQAESGGSVGGSSGGGALFGPIGALATQQLGATAVGTVVDQLEEGLRASLGLDVLNITPAPLPAELAVQGYLNVFRGAQFEAGAYLTDRWFLAGQGRTAAVLPGMRLEYRTPSGFEWVTSWEPRYLVPEPSLNFLEAPETSNVLGVFLQWRRRF